MNSSEFSVGCPICEQWFHPMTSIPIDCASCEALVVSGVSYLCPQCEILVPCSEKNSCVRFSDTRSGGIYWGAWMEEHAFFSDDCGRDRCRQKVEEMENEGWIYLGPSGFADGTKYSVQFIKRSTRFKV
jgi:hypothetical protein